MKTSTLALAGLGLAAASRLALRNTGVTIYERRRPLRGDDLVPGAGAPWTMATTVDAPPAAVWQWLVQLGSDRGGFYSYTWLENLVGAKIHNADRILPGIRPSAA